MNAKSTSQIISFICLIPLWANVNVVWKLTNTTMQLARKTRRKWINRIWRMPLLFLYV